MCELQYTSLFRDKKNCKIECYYTSMVGNDMMETNAAFHPKLQSWHRLSVRQPITWSSGQQVSQSFS